MSRPVRVYGVKKDKPDPQALALTFILIAQAMLEQEERKAAEKKASEDTPQQ
jgi:hypothetical protein